MAGARLGDAPMMALTLYQPWATLIILQEKRIETRSWYTKYRGVLAIHAGSTSPVFDLRPFMPVLKRARLTADDLPLGKIIGFCDLVDVRPVQNIPRSMLTKQERAFGNYSPGRYGWILENARQIKPIPARGMQRLWNWNDRDFDFQNEFLSTPFRDERGPLFNQRGQ